MYVINTYSYTLDFSAETCLERLADQGYVAFELMMYPGHAWPSEMDTSRRRDFVRLLERRGLQIPSLNMPNLDLNLAGATPEMRRYSQSVLREVINVAGDLGVPRVVIGPGKPNPLFPAPKEKLIGWFFESLDALVPIAKQADVELVVENMPVAFLPDASSLMNVVERYGSERVNIIYDLSNAVFIGEDLREGMNRIRDRLHLLHLTESPLEKYKHDRLGGGAVPFEETAQIVREIGYSGPFVLEIIDPDPDQAMVESIGVLERAGWASLVKDGSSST